MPQDTTAAPSTQNTFEIGIVMAGAISAGAYSAGVMDFITEALDAYEEAKKDPNWDGPTHTVRVPVLAGASAGGMTAAISALQLFHDIEHVSPTCPPPAPAANRLYSSWVTDISLDALLETGDLSGGRVKSLLCADVLDRIADDAFDICGNPRTRAWVGRGDDRALKVLLTLSNLRGVPYGFKIFGQDKELGMLNHSDYFDFTVGIEPGEREGSHVIDLSKPTDGNRNLFKDVVLATGAFPIGLLPRRIERPASDYWSAQSVGFQDPRNGVFQPIPPRYLDKNAPYSFLAVDGGAMNNEPLEIARRYLTGFGQSNKRDGIKADKAIILLAPFPHFGELPEDSADDAIFSVSGQLVSALINQARFKPDELEKAADNTVFSRFMISPSHTIACGVLGGFGGFIHESFRRHDYLLGRRDAQKFLSCSFALPETNSLFDNFHPDKRGKWYLRHGYAYCRFAERVKGGASAKGLPIIPLVGKLQEEIKIGQQDTPRPFSANLRVIEGRVRRRATKVVETFAVRLLREAKRSAVGGAIGTAAGLCVTSVISRLWGPVILSRKANAKIRDAVAEVAEAFGVPQPVNPSLRRELDQKLRNWQTVFRLMASWPRTSP